MARRRRKSRKSRSRKLTRKQKRAINRAKHRALMAKRRGRKSRRGRTHFSRGRAKRLRKSRRNPSGAIYLSASDMRKMRKMRKMLKSDSPRGRSLRMKHALRGVELHGDEPSSPVLKKALATLKKLGHAGWSRRGRRSYARR
jgi:hypothetical protein